MPEVRAGFLAVVLPAVEAPLAADSAGRFEDGGFFVAMALQSWGFGEKGAART